MVLLTLAAPGASAAETPADVETERGLTLAMTGETVRAESVFVSLYQKSGSLLAPQCRGGGSAAFVPGPVNLIATRSDTGYADPGPAGSYYKLSAVDVNGNEGGYAGLGPNGTVGVEAEVPLALALEGVRPNPSWGERLSVALVLPSGAAARLELLDVSGRRVAGREVGSLGAGRHVVELVAGRRLAPGLYLVRLTRGPDTRVARVVVLE